MKVALRNEMATEMRDAFLEGWDAGSAWQALLAALCEQDEFEVETPRNPYDPFDMPNKRVADGLSEFELTTYTANQHKAGGWHAGFSAAMGA